jgi:hypothetical protein
LDSIHFLTDNLLDIFNYPKTKRRIGIDARHDFIYKTGPDEQLGILGLLVGRRCFACFGEEMRHSHVSSPYCLSLRL